MKPFIADVHTHSILSGHAFGTVRELAAEAAARNLKILGVTEHGPGIPGTCNPILFRNFIDAPRNLYGVEMLYGSETNVLNSGKVDLEPARAEVERVLEACSRNHTPCEFILKDVSTVSARPQVLGEWVQMVNEAIDRKWKP